MLFQIPSTDIGSYKVVVELVDIELGCYGNMFPRYLAVKSNSPTKPTRWYCDRPGGIIRIIIIHNIL